MKRTKSYLPGNLPVMLALVSLSAIAQENSALAQSAVDDPIPLVPSELSGAEPASAPESTGFRRISFEDSSEEAQPAEPAASVGLTRFSQPAASRTSAAGPVTYGDDESSQSRRANDPAGPVQSGIAAAEDNPFAPTGFRLGTFNANASLEQAIGYSSNISGRAGGEGGAFSQTDVNFGLASDWGRHEFRYNLNGSYRRPFDSDEIDEPFLFTNAALRLDLVDGFALTTNGYYNFSTQSFTSSSITPGAVDTPGIHGFGGSIELARTQRKLTFSLRGSLDRTTYEDANLGGGLVQSEEDRNNNLHQLTARVGYEATPVLSPFVEGRIGWRSYDLAIDRNGNRRDSEITEIRGGIGINFGEKLNGEISVGLVNESFEDPTLSDLEGVTLNSILEWSPERDTLVRLNAGTALNGSVSAGDSGSLVYTASVELERQISDRLQFSANVNYELDDNVDQDTTIGLGVGLEYWINRFMAITADVEYETFTSNTVGSDFDETSARMGIRLQR